MGFAIAGAALAGAAISSQATGAAASSQANAAAQANQTQTNMYNQSRQDQMPWLDAGKNALGQIQNQMPEFQRNFSMADFQNDPGYQFRMAEGQKAIERSAAARGGLNSGATMKALTRFGQDSASQEYQNAYTRFNTDRDARYNKLASMAGLGQTSSANMAAQANSTGQALGQNILGAGNAQAAGQIGQANAINSGIGNGMNSWMQYQYMNQNKNQVPELTSYYQNGNGGGNAGYDQWGENTGSGFGGSSYMNPSNFG